MRVAIIYSHPKEKSFNHAILKKVEEVLSSREIEYKIIDLYKENFKAPMDEKDFQNIESNNFPQDVLPYQESIKWAELLIFIFPVWWWSYPAILKGFIDRVFLANFAYKFDKNGLNKLLKGKKAIVFMTTGGKEEDYEKNKAKDILIRPLRDGLLGFCGIEDVDFHIFYAVPYVPNEKRVEYLKEVEEVLRKI